MKTGIIIVCHGKVASAMRESAQLFFGDIEDLVAIDYDLSEGVESLKSRIVSSLNLFAGRPILILTDILGGSPTNIVIELLKTSKEIDLITGMNLPILHEILFYRHRFPGEKMPQEVIEGAKKGLIHYREFLKVEKGWG